MSARPSAVTAELRFVESGRVVRLDLGAKAPTDQRLAYSVAETAELVGVGKDIVYSWIKNRDLVAIRLGSHMVVLREDLVSFLHSQRETS